MKNWIVKRNVFFFFLVFWTVNSKCFHYKIFAMTAFELRSFVIGSNCSANWAAISVTILGDFYKLLATNCLTKEAQIFGLLFGLYLMSLLCKKVCGYFLGYFYGKSGNLLFHHLVTLAQPLSQVRRNIS